MVGEGECSNHIFKHAETGRFRFLGWCVPPSEASSRMGKAAADTDGMDTSTRSAALPCLLCRSPFAAVSLFQLAPPPSSTAAQHRLTA